MSGAVVNKFWHLGNHTYVFYRFALEDFCRKCFIKPKLLMLDAGCGPNISSLSHIPDNVLCVGIDVNTKNVATSHRKAKTERYQNISFVVGSIEDLPFCDRIFDLILCCDTLEHIKDRNKALREISRLCISRGKFLGSTSNLFNPLVLLDTLLPSKITTVLSRKFAGEHYERHFRFSSAGLLKALIEAGFEKCEVKLLGFPPFKPWIYEFSSRKLPLFAFLWIASDKLTNRKPLRLLKETIVFFAIKK